MAALSRQAPAARRRAAASTCFPTGRNLYGIDPRAVPTRTAWEIGRRAAPEVMNRHVQDHGEWPKRIVMDLWASATMRTGGDDLAQAFALMGVKPVWDHASSRLTGFEIIPPARLTHPRVDVTLRISGLFRDVFPAQIALFDQAVQALSEHDEEDEVNPYAAAAQTCAGKSAAHLRRRAWRLWDRPWPCDRRKRHDSRAKILASAISPRPRTPMAAPEGEAVHTRAFRERVAAADALIHVQDQDEQDILDSDAIVDHEGGFAAAAKMLGNDAAVYHVSSARPGAIKVRTLDEEIARVVRARASNPRWIAGQMRHGHRGAAEIAETIDNLYALAVLTDAVASQHFDLMFDATLGTPAVRDFLVEANPKAARAIVQRFEEALRAASGRAGAIRPSLPRFDAGGARMMKGAQLRKGWCPGAWRPMPAKDGLLLRLRISGGIVAAATLRGLAQAGREHGNGLFDLSARGNLQIRGVRESNLAALIETLDGLGLIDENAFGGGGSQRFGEARLLGFGRPERRARSGQGA